MAVYNTIVISVGGSIIVPDDVDVKFLKAFRSLLRKHIKRGTRFAVICGGGKTCRRYQEAARNVAHLSDRDLDWIGIHATRLNAQLMRAIFAGAADDKIVKDPEKEIIFNKKVLVAAGWKPGFSTDCDAVLIAKQLGANKVVNLTNIDCVCDKDPKRHKDAKAISDISWTEFRKLLPKKWSPGLNAPFDPVASKLAERFGLTVAVMNGRNIKNLDAYLSGRRFVGTEIS